MSDFIRNTAQRALDALGEDPLPDHPALHHDVWVLANEALAPSTPTAGGLLGYQWRVGDIGQERSERLGVPRWSIVGRDPDADVLDEPRVALSVSNNVAVGDLIALAVATALNDARGDDPVRDLSPHLEQST